MKFKCLRLIVLGKNLINLDPFLFLVFMFDLLCRILFARTIRLWICVNYFSLKVHALILNTHSKFSNHSYTLYKLFHAIQNEMIQTGFQITSNYETAVYILQQSCLLKKFDVRGNASYVILNFYIVSYSLMYLLI